MQTGRNKASRPAFRPKSGPPQNFSNNGPRNGNNFNGNRYNGNPFKNQNRNFNTRQPPSYNRPPVRNVPATDIEQLARQMNDMQIKLAQMDPLTLNTSLWIAMMKFPLASKWKRKNTLLPLPRLQATNLSSSCTTMATMTNLTAIKRKTLTTMRKPGLRLPLTNF